MTKDKALEELFLAKKPHFDDHDTFMANLTKRLDAVEFIHQHQEATIRRYKMAMIATFVIGIISGAITMAFILSMPADVPLFNFHVHTGFLLLFTEISRPVVATALALLMTIGSISVIINIQDIYNIMNMNKKIFITMMLALVTMTGQAQVKSGLDLCLRDEVTGEWLIGLFDDYAIYDCEYWNYAEVDKDHVVLTKDGQRKEVRLKKNAAIIDGSKHKTSVLTAQFLPDYPSKDETSWPSGINAEEGNFTLRVCVHTTKTEADFVSYIHRMTSR